jgi:hypothetical protein
MAFQLERFVTLLQTTLSIDMMSANDTSMTLTSATGLPSSGQIRALLTEGSNQEIVLATLPAHLDNSLDIQRKVEPVGGVQNNYLFHAGTTVEFIYTAGNLSNDPRNMSAQGDLETLDASGAVTRIPAGSEGSSYFVVNGQPVSAPGVDATFTNPATGTNADDQFLSQYTVIWDASMQLPTFSNYQVRKAVLNVTHGQNDHAWDPDPFNKKTFFVEKAVLNARGCGQRIGQSYTINGWGGGDVFAADHTVNFAGCVTAAGDEGQLVYRGSFNEIGGLIRDSIASVATKPDISTTLNGAVSLNGTSLVMITVHNIGTKTRSGYRSS